MTVVRIAAETVSRARRTIVTVTVEASLADHMAVMLTAVDHTADHIVAPTAALITVDHVIAAHTAHTAVAHAIVALRTAVPHAEDTLAVAALHTAALHAVDTLVVRIAVVLVVDSLVDHMVLMVEAHTVTEEVHTVAVPTEAVMVTAAIANSEFQHPDLSIHHTMYFAH